MLSVQGKFGKDMIQSIKTKDVIFIMLDVYDRNGEYIGIIKNRFLDRQNAYLIALTDSQPNKVVFNENKLKSFLAGLLKIKSLFGRIDEIRLKEEIDNLRFSDEYSKYKNLSYENFKKYLFLKKYIGKNMEEYLEINGLSEDRIKGYIIFDINKAEIQEDKFIIDEEIDYIGDQSINTTLIPRRPSLYSFTQNENEWNDNIKPIFGEITGYPMFYTDIMGLGEGFILGANISDFGGRNHSHETRLKIKSGNYEDIFDFPILINAKLGMNIHLYLGEKRIEQLYCDGSLYKF